jgi:hypothetical protein
LRILPKLRGILPCIVFFTLSRKKIVLDFLQGGFYRFEQHKTKKAL